MSDKDKLSRFYVDESQVEIINDTSLTTDKNGSSSSGNHGHSGRPGVVGGSSGSISTTVEAFNKRHLKESDNEDYMNFLSNGIKGEISKDKDIVNEVLSYQANSQHVNRWLATHDESNKSFEGMVTMDKAFTQELTSDTKLYKGLSQDYYGILNGTTSFTDKAYGSTTLNGKEAASSAFSNGLILSISAKSGQKVVTPDLYSGDKDNISVFTQSEVILPRGVEYKVKKINTSPDGYTKVIDVEIIGDTLTKNSLDIEKNYSPSQPRDSIGRFSSGPGGSKSITSSSESKQIEKLKSVEKNIRNNDYETFVAVSPSGKVLLNKKGTKSEVLISKQEIEDMSRANNVIFTHNHPSSNSFSLNDMHMGMSINAKEIRIVSKKYTYSLKPPKISMSLVGPRDNHWPNPENLNNIMKEQESINYDKLVPKVQSGEISTETAWLTHTHNVIKSTAKTFEMEYSRVEIK